MPAGSHIGEPFAEGLAFPEGPVVLTDGTLAFTQIAAGLVSTWSAGEGVTTLARTGGGPNGATVDAHGRLYVTQNGGAEGGGTRAVPAIQRIDADGSVTTVTSEVGGLRLDAPNDLAFGPDGRLFFTDPRGGPDDDRRPGRLYAINAATGAGELIAELAPVYPNGIGFLADGTLVWTESFSRRVMTMTTYGPGEIVELPERHFPDGFCVGADRRLYVAATYGHCVDVIENGVVVDSLVCGTGMPTNCCFVGTDLVVTESRYGTLWRFPLGVEGLPLHTGRP